MRIFFAVAPSQEALARIEGVVSVLRRRARSDEIRWSVPENLHFTLKFLGEQTEERASLAIEVAREVSLVSAPFEIRLASLGAFPSPTRPRVLWMGAAEPSASALITLSERLDRGLAEAGFDPESRPFHPHLTLARGRSRDAGEDLARLLSKMGDLGEVATSLADGFVLMQSELSRAGSSYSILERFSFGGS